MYSKDSGSDLNHDILEKLCKWQNVMIQSESNPELVLNVLLQSHDFATARDWSKLHKVSKELHQVGIMLDLIEKTNLFIVIQ